MKNLLPILLFIAVVSGCAKHGPIGSFCGPLPEEAAVSAIAADAVKCLISIYPPGHTTLRLLPAKDAENGFAVALESGLRAKGFTLADASDAVTLAYTLDALDEKSAWYLQLRISDGAVIARTYAANGLPEAGQSKTVLESVRSGMGKLVDAAKDKAGRAYDTTREFLTE